VPRNPLRACALLALVALLAPLAPAAAETWSGRDPRGDVEGYTYVSPASEDECPTITDIDGSADTNDDITRLRVRHTATSVIVATRFRDLDARLDQLLMLHIKSADRGWYLDVSRSVGKRGKSRTFTFLAREPKYPDPDEIDPDGDGCGSFIVASVGLPCPHMAAKVDTDRDVITATLPRTCIRSPRWVRVGAGSAGSEDLDPPKGQPDAISFNGYYDVWSDGGAGTDWLPPFGPRVRVRPGVVG
jgi:hypothetical protein